MLKRVLILISIIAASAACSNAPEGPDGYTTPESAVVAWFEAIDSADYESALLATHAESLVLILGIENNLDAAAVAGYLDNGVPVEVQVAYWSTFSAGFAEFAARPISTLTVGESEIFMSEGVEFASVPVGGIEPGSVVLTRMRGDGIWEVDLVATLGDGFVRLLATEFGALPNNEAGDRIRRAYEDTVVPALWAGMAQGSYGDDFTRTALALIDQVT